VGAPGAGADGGGAAGAGGIDSDSCGVVGTFGPAPRKQFSRCGYAFTSAFGRVEPTHHVRSRVMNRAPGTRQIALLVIYETHPQEAAGGVTKSLARASFGDC
jgi:hypothetical protein